MLKIFIARNVRVILRIKWLLLATVLFGVVSVISGILFDLTKPLPGPGPGNTATYPIPIYIKVASYGPFNTSVSLFIHNFISEIIILVTSLFHFGLVAVYSIFWSLFELGGILGWFAKQSSFGVWKGLLSYLPHLVPVLFAVCLISSLSIWIGIGLIKPEAELSRFETIKDRYLSAVILMPLIATLLIIGAFLESFISIPLATTFSQGAVLAEERKIFSDSAIEDRWAIKVPVSWIVTPEEYPGGDGQMAGTFLAGMNVPLCIEITALNQDGVLGDSEKKKLAEVQLTKLMEYQELKKQDSLQEYKIAGHLAYGVSGLGREKKFQYFQDSSSLGNKIVFENLIFMTYNNEVQHNHTEILIKIIVDPEYQEYTQPLVNDILSSFQLRIH